jgi:hypothetical protein
MTVVLTKATELGQEVNGTSSGSIYIVCLIADSFKMAIRNNGNVLSIRVEPREGVPFPVVALQQLGFGGTQFDTYASQHFKCDGGPLSLCGAYGALIEQINFLFEEEEIVSMKWGSLINSGT